MKKLISKGDQEWINEKLFEIKKYYILSKEFPNNDTFKTMHRLCQDRMYQVKKDILKRIYLDYVNNFISPLRFSEYYGISRYSANRLINHFRNN